MKAERLIIDFEDTTLEVPYPEEDIQILFNWEEERCGSIEVMESKKISAGELFRWLVGKPDDTARVIADEKLRVENADLRRQLTELNKVLERERSANVILRHDKAVLQESHRILALRYGEE